MKVIINRESAIKYALSIANKKSIVLVAGKGHENFQEIKDKKFPFNDKDIINKHLK